MHGHNLNLGLGCVVNLRIFKWIAVHVDNWKRGSCPGVGSCPRGIVFHNVVTHQSEMYRAYRLPNG